MGRRIFKSSLIALSFICLGLDAKATVVHDATSFVKFAEIASQSTQMLGKLQSMTSELTTLNSVLGNPLQGKIMDHVGNGSWLASDFGNVLESFDSPYGDPLSALNSLGSNQLGMEDKSQYLFIKDYAKSKLFNDDSSSQPLSFQQQDEINEVRYTTLKESSINSVALSGQQKSSLKDSNEEIISLSKQSKSDRTIQDEIRTTNQLLVVIANEMTQQRAILAQVLELKAAVVAQQMPVVFNKTSLSKKPSQSTSPSQKSKLSFGKNK